MKDSVDEKPVGLKSVEAPWREGGRGSETEACGE